MGSMSGANQISKALRLDFKELKRRICDRSSREMSSEFVELKVGRLFSTAGALWRSDPRPGSNSKFKPMPLYRRSVRNCQAVS